MAAKRQEARRPRAAEDDRAKGRLKSVAGYLAEAGSRDLDRLVYERVRLGIMSALAVNRKLSFSELKDLLRTTDGNLSVHARKLEDAGYLECEKSFQGRFPRTDYRLTSSGRQALKRYLDHMEALIRATREDAAGGGDERG